MTAQFETRQRKDYTPEERERIIKAKIETDCESYNRETGHLNAIDGIECADCKNRGMIAVPQKNEAFGYWTMVMKECECKKRRKSVQQIKSSGLGDALERCTFNSFEANEDWQQNMKTIAEKYVEGDGGLWFYAGGQIGAGKSHICTAICGEFLKQNQGVLYMLWKDESSRLKGMANDSEQREREIDRYKNIDVLYIDDFFKTQRASGKGTPPTAADVNLAFEILNYRYVSRKKTVISSEWMISEICEFDEAVGSRIHELSKGSKCQIQRNPSRNYRIRD